MWNRLWMTMTPAIMISVPSFVRLYIVTQPRAWQPHLMTRDKQKLGIRSVTWYDHRTITVVMTCKSMIYFFIPSSMHCSLSHTSYLFRILPFVASHTSLLLLYPHWYTTPSLATCISINSHTKARISISRQMAFPPELIHASFNTVRKHSYFRQSLTVGADAHHTEDYV